MGAANANWHISAAATPAFLPISASTINLAAVIVTIVICVL